MSRGVNGTDALETINAAASVIASAENRVPQVSAQKRRWRSYWSLFWCFGSDNNKQRIGHAVLVPETPTTRADGPTAENPPQPLSIVLPFVAPPSSPASFLPSEPPSATQSPTGLISLTSISANMYSPGGPSSIFAIGPYAHETQLVSPPVFSTFTTEPSTAPYTPPPESVHLTTPSSPEVPFARLLEPSFQSGEGGQRYPLSQYEFQSYQLQPGSPVSHLISPSSGISGSGTSSPFPDLECTPGHPLFVEFRTGNHTQFLNLDKIVIREWESYHGSGALTPDGAWPKSRDSFLLNHHGSDITPLPDERNGLRNDETVVNHRVSFEITAEEVVRCVEKKPAAFPEFVPESVENVERTAEENPSETNAHENPEGVTSNITSDKAPTHDEDERKHQKNRTITLGSSKEFNFDNIDGENSDKPKVGSNWWANEKVLGEEDGGPSKIWSFPMMQTSVS
ncbi:hydroxyproline-rich glycoprotein family protein [Forsythia ovata]|uniref:Hydroxyproline-rich glycoprotein family protein n=1 Tax=Forsythia ovata TaxID=205694 RepID=A0ABD1W6X9_9LAMI